MGEGIELLNGQMFDYLNPSATPEVSIEELAHILSNVCRFAGHVRYFYSVAQHALNVSLIVDQAHRKAGLLHDTAEGFTNDITTPLKFVIGPVFKQIEVGIETDMARRFGFQYPLSDEVKLADLQMLAIEKEVLKPFPSHWAILDGIDIEPIRHIPLMAPMTPEQAKAAFLQRWEEVCED